MADRAPYLLTRTLGAVLAFVAALVLVFAFGAFAYLKAQPLQVLDVLIAPFILVFWAAPPLFVVGMASRSKTALSAALALLLAVMILIALQLYHGMPWHYPRWRGNLNDASFQLFIVVLFLFWPLVAIGGLLWRVLNRRADP